MFDFVAFARNTPASPMARASSVPVGVTPYETVNEVNETHNSGYFNQYLYAQPPIQHFSMPYHQMPNVIFFFVLVVHFQFAKQTINFYMFFILFFQICE